jgi:hypothetical protein
MVPEAKVLVITVTVRQKFDKLYDMIIIEDAKEARRTLDMQISS